MLRLISFLFFLGISTVAFSATCNIAVTANWNACVCSQTGLAPVSGDAVIVNSGVTLTFTTDPNFTGTLTINGTVVNNKANATWNGNIILNSGGELTLNQKLDIGTSSGCGYTLTVNGTGHLSLNGSGGSDLLSICNQKVAQSGGGCGTYPAGPLPYCDPGSGFTGPFVFNQGGLPIQLLYFDVTIPKNESHALIEWATSSEENFDHFEIERAGKDLTFSTIAEVPGAGYNTSSKIEYSAKDENPLIGIGYYRLKAVDIDKTYEYFKIKSVSYDGGRKLMVWANPASAKGFKYSINFEPRPNDRVVLVNQVGTEILSAPVKGTENEIIPDIAIKSGAYMLRYVSSDFHQTARVFIKD